MNCHSPWAQSLQRISSKSRVLFKTRLLTSRGFRARADFLFPLLCSGDTEYDRSLYTLSTELSGWYRARADIALSGSRRGLSVVSGSRRVLEQEPISPPVAFSNSKKDTVTSLALRNLYFFFPSSVLKFSEAMRIFRARADSPPSRHLIPFAAACVDCKLSCISGRTRARAELFPKEHSSCYYVWLVWPFRRQIKRTVNTAPQTTTTQ